MQADAVAGHAVRAADAALEQARQQVVGDAGAVVGHLEHERERLVAVDHAQQHLAAGR